MASLLVLSGDYSHSTNITNFDQTFRLLDLPPELRMEIYDLLFASIASTPTNENVTHTTALMCTCRQVLQEASLSFLKYKIRLLNMLRKRRSREVKAIFSVEWKSAGYRRLQTRESLEVKKRYDEESQSIARMARLVRKIGNQG